MGDKRERSFPVINKSELISTDMIRPGEYNIRLKTFNGHQDMIMNDMSLFILESCNGENSVIDIRDYIKSNYDIDDMEVVDQDLDLVLNELFCLQVIYFENTNYLLDDYMLQKDTLTIKYLQLQDAIALTQSLKLDHIYAYFANTRALNDLFRPSVAPYNWYDHLTGYYKVTKERRDIADIIVIPEPKICGFRILYLDVLDITEFNDKKTDIFQFIYSIYKDKFGIDVTEHNESICFMFTSKSMNEYHTIFDYLGKSEKEIDGQTVYWYSYMLNIKERKEI